MSFRRASLISVISLIVFLFVGEVNSPLYNGFLAFALLALGNMNFNCDVPDLSQLRELGTVFAARRAFQGAGPTDYKATAVYGHFGRDDIDAPWERLDKVETLRKHAGLDGDPRP